jgi:hypothetical protein
MIVDAPAIRSNSDKWNYATQKEMLLGPTITMLQAVLWLAADFIFKKMLDGCEQVSKARGISDLKFKFEIPCAASRLRSEMLDAFQI